MSPLNIKPGLTIDVDCGCRGVNPGCVNCRGVGTVRLLSCKRCGGTGRTGGSCLDCRGQGYRDVELL